MAGSIFLIAALAIAAPQVQVGDLHGASSTGEFAKLSNDKLTLTSSAGETTLPVDQLLYLSPQAAPLPTEAPKPTAWISLVDGSPLVADKFVVDSTDKAALALGNNHFALLGTGGIRAVRFSRPDDPSSPVWPAKAWTDSAGDLLVVRKKDQVDFLEGRLGEVNDNAVTIRVDGENFPASRTKVDGLVYYHKTGEEYPNPLCVMVTNTGWKLKAKSVSFVGELPAGLAAKFAPSKNTTSKNDAAKKTATEKDAAKPDSSSSPTAAGNPGEQTGGDKSNRTASDKAGDKDASANQTATFEVATAEQTGGWLKVNTLGDAEVYVPWNALSRLDFSAGKIVYLSDLEPESTQWTPYLDFGAAAPALAQYYAVRRDAGPEHPALELGGKSFAKGLSIYSRTAVVYRVPSGIKKFKATAGIDDSAREAGRVRLEISADGKTLFDRAISGMQPPQELDLDVAGAKRLTILVDYGDAQDLGDFLDLAEARMLK